MRGTRLSRALGTLCGRFIPADAGNTRPTRSSRVTNAVHPRGCGEHVKVDDCVTQCFGSSPRMRGTRGISELTRWAQTGSSPRMRGTPHLGGAPDRRCRFIPADAGNTNTSGANLDQFLVHPRGCGEHDQVILERAQGIRFIPADAGNTCQKSSCWPLPAVHPRGCGEHPARRCLVIRQLRFIPADAGNTKRPGR